MCLLLWYVRVLFVVNILAFGMMCVMAGCDL